MSGFLDTSVVVRYLTGDVPELADRAASLIEGEEILWLTDVVLAETAYVLTTVYGSPRPVVIDHLIGLIQRNNIRTYGVDKGLVLQALQMCRPSGRVSFADAMIWAAARTQGSNVVYSLDERFPADGIEVRTGR